MNCMLGEKYISVRGIENAMELAKVLVKNDYQVMVQLDDCDIYIVAYTSNQSWNDTQFALVDFDEIDLLEGCREKGEFEYLMSRYEDEARGYLEEEDETEDEDDYDDSWDNDFYDDDEDDEEDLDDEDWDELTDEMGDEGKNFQSNFVCLKGRGFKG